MLSENKDLPGALQRYTACSGNTNRQVRPVDTGVGSFGGGDTPESCAEHSANPVLRQRASVLAVRRIGPCVGIERGKLRWSPADRGDGPESERSEPPAG